MFTKREVTIIGLFAAGVVLVACGAEPQSVRYDPSGVKTGLITTIKGCEVYQIDRGGMTNPIFTTICPAESGQTASTSYQESCGKNCTRNMEVPTNRLGGEVNKKFQERLTNG